MARLINLSGQITKALCALPTILPKRYESSSQLTLAVRKKIEETRQKALLGGGQQRIDNQHKKARNYSCIFIYIKL